MILPEFAVSEVELTMAEYIDKDALLKDLKDKHDVLTEYYWNYIMGFECAMDIVSKALPLNVAIVKHGKWISTNPHGYEWTFVCSECGYVDGYPFNERHNYCPNCGARCDL